MVAVQLTADEITKKYFFRLIVPGKCADSAPQAVFKRRRLLFDKPGPQINPGTVCRKVINTCGKKFAIHREGSFVHFLLVYFFSEHIVNRNDCSPAKHMMEINCQQLFNR